MTFTQLVLAVMQATTLTQTESTQLVSNWCENRFFQPNTEQVEQVCSPVWEKTFNYKK